MRSAGSKGAFDVIAYNKKTVRFIQSKYTSTQQRNYNKDAERIRGTKVPSNCTKELWVYVKNIGFYAIYFFPRPLFAVEVPKGSRIILDEYSGTNHKRKPKTSR